MPSHMKSALQCIVLQEEWEMNLNPCTRNTLVRAVILILRSIIFCKVVLLWVSNHFVITLQNMFSIICMSLIMGPRVGRIYTLLFTAFEHDAIDFYNIIIIQIKVYMKTLQQIYLCMFCGSDCAVLVSLKCESDCTRCLYAHPLIRMKATTVLACFLFCYFQREVSGTWKHQMSRKEREADRELVKGEAE